MMDDVWPHRVLHGINFTVERLNLPPGLVGLLLGLPQRVSVALCGLSQIIKLQEQKMKHTIINNYVLLYVPVWLSVCLSAYLGLVPVLRLLHVLRSNGLILGPDVPQSTSEVRPGGALHLHLQLLGLDTHLYVLNFLIIQDMDKILSETQNCYIKSLSTIKKQTVLPLKV